ncbi:hypothetical protein BDW75DRAFT_114135 [Aspergillus navahoensis]
MQPPSDHANDFRHCPPKLAIHHQSRPPATAIASINYCPSPSYAAAIATHDINQNDDSDYKYDDNDHYGHDNTAEYYTTTIPSFPAPGTTPNKRSIMINLDSSIHIHGDGNILTIASRQGQTQAQAQTQTQTQPQTSDPKSKVANTTASIIAALQQSGILASEPDSSSGSASTTMKINIDAGIKVRGVQNVVCFGALMVPATSARGSKMNMAMNNYDVKKRRAQSEPATGESERKRHRRR